MICLKYNYIFIILVAIVVDYGLINFIENIAKTRISNEETHIISQARTHFNDQVNYRIWNAQYDGVYVKPKPNQEPNPYLINNTLKSEDNQTLIKINPDWMTSQLSELAKTGDYTFRIISFAPLNPSNFPNNFEKEALKFMVEKSKTEFFTFNEKEKSFKYMGALITNESCMQCHAEQGYKVGDIRGGISILIDLEEYFANKNDILKKKMMIEILIVIVSIIIIFLIFRVLKHTVELELKVEERTKELRKLSQLDSLTGINNRGHFMDISEKYFNIALRNKTQIHILSIDIDNFKNINDTFGHQAGDKVIVSFAKTVNELLRNSDLFGRVGGEEFSILLQNTSKDGAISFAERIRVSTEEMNILYEDKVIKVTVSIGLATLNDESNISELLKNSDVALYCAKNEGRNQVKIFN